MKYLIERLIRPASVCVLAILFTPYAQALLVNATVISHTDPNNYLGLNGLVSIGDNATADFFYTGLPNFSIPYDDGTDREEHIFQSGQAGSLFTVNGIANTTPSPRGDHTTLIQNNVDGAFGFGDSYIFNEFFTSPEASYTSLIWSVILHDSSGTAHSSTNFYDVNSTAGFDQIYIVGYLWNAHTQTSESLLVAAQTVPLPAGVWLLGSALAGLIGIQRKRK